MLKQIVTKLEDKIYTALRKRIEQLSPLSDQEWEDFSSAWKMKLFKKGDFVIKVGEIEPYFYFVYSGVHRLFGDKNDEEINVGFAYNGDYSGVFDSFLAQKPSEFYIESISESTVLRINYPSLMHYFDKYRSVERWGRLFNAEMLILMVRRQMEARSYSAEEKFKRLYDQSPHIFQLVPQKYLASYLGMTPETFSRLRAKIR
jgi:CRP-like cAMP-binding protein